MIDPTFHIVHAAERAFVVSAPPECAEFRGTCGDAIRYETQRVFDASLTGQQPVERIPVNGGEAVHLIGTREGDGATG